MSGNSEKCPTVEMKRNWEVSLRSRSANSLKTIMHQMFINPIWVVYWGISGAYVSGIMIISTAFSWTCQPNMKEVNAHRTTLWKKTTTSPARRHNVHKHGCNTRDSSMSFSFAALRTGLLFCRTSIASTVQTRVWRGVMLGSTTCSNSCTKPPVMDADVTTVALR